MEGACMHQFQLAALLLLFLIGGVYTVGADTQSKMVGVPSNDRMRAVTQTPTVQARPGAFEKVTPFNGMRWDGNKVTLLWSVSRYATRYEYCVATSAAACTTWINAGNVNWVRLTTLQNGRTYYWQVRARNGVGMTTASNAVWRFSTVVYPTITPTASIVPTPSGGG